MVRWMVLLIGTLAYRHSFSGLASVSNSFPGPNDTLSLHTPEVKRLSSDGSVIRTPNVDVGCNFSNLNVIGFPPFSQNTDETLCSLHIKERTAGFMYFCDGRSKPAGCPTSIMHMYGERDLSSLFDQSYMDARAVPGTDSKAWLVYLTRPIGAFDGLCICYRTDGSKMTLRLSAGHLTPSIIAIVIGALVTTIHFI